MVNSGRWHGALSLGMDRPCHVDDSDPQMVVEMMMMMMIHCFGCNPDCRCRRHVFRMVEWTAGPHSMPSRSMDSIPELIRWKFCRHLVAVSDVENVDTFLSPIVVLTRQMVAVNDIDPLPWWCSRDRRAVDRSCWNDDAAHGRTFSHTWRHRKWIVVLYYSYETMWWVVPRHSTEAAPEWIGSWLRPLAGSWHEFPKGPHDQWPRDCERILLASDYDDDCCCRYRFAVADGWVTMNVLVVFVTAHGSIDAVGISDAVPRPWRYSAVDWKDPVVVVVRWCCCCCWYRPLAAAVVEDMVCFRVFAVSMVAKFVSRVVVVLHLHSFCYLRRSAVVFVVAVHVAFVSSSWVVETM